MSITVAGSHVILKWILSHHVHIVKRTLVFKLTVFYFCLSRQRENRSVVEQNKTDPMRWQTKWCTWIGDKKKLFIFHTFQSLVQLKCTWLWPLFWGAFSEKSKNDQHTLANWHVLTKEVIKLNAVIDFMFS